ncbi:MAG: type transport system ATP-binding protein [Solirubrobacteraceae bacterium]|jgi:ABC-type polysaccharide/polyol phosphate transport system ATPase subunit|nr:type transport system ATP-binding protein [Solirubrobacteraceae bacterium]
MAPVVIEVRGVGKTFRIPDERVDSLKERVTHPLKRVEYRELHALHDISFDVCEGEFFGVVGRNGSGKSTLLKILASIYRADTGTVRVAGQMAPFIELGVGFNPEQAAFANVVLNGVLMGLGTRDARRRFDAVLDFAELRDFADVKLKNYSSGMMVRLAFAIMVQADSDIMLIDEVLAVGDAAFAAKCTDVFEERRRAGRTVILVTHDMGAVETLCHRALVLHEGEQEYVGDPNDAARRYYSRNFQDGVEPGYLVTVSETRAERRFAIGAPIGFDVTLETLLPFTGGSLQVQIHNENHVEVAGFVHEVGVAAVGERLRLAGEIENRLHPGQYHLDCWVHRHEGDKRSVQGLRLLEFDVDGPEGEGIVRLDSNVELVRE